ncbi:Myc-type, basic helix-loop-helix (bHLH) domain containing protein [Parasponia andersonii]|uniref:Myc-type, basic helix-loop-helix (BHLH) domain containing protein n=1 Tax=Parasponia andersonii TaxID=3476 RepID=A0A2P5DPT1_PARAD|nr:Myc-type, basic helix-loop-helix (bHLH) domain containing protein [Parasponia andersonii]
MKNAILPSVSTHYDFGSINYELQMFNENLHSSSSFFMEPIPKALDNENQQRSAEGYSFPFQSSPLVTYQQAAYPSTSSSCDVIDNISHQQSVLPGKKILAPQFEVDFQAIQNTRKRPIKDNDMLPRSGTNWELLSEGTNLNEYWGKNKRSKVTNNDQEWQLQQVQEALSGMQEHKLQVPVKRSQKLTDKITALQKLVSPYGKTDTASVLQEASLYIKLLQEQIQNLFRMMCSSYDNVRGPHSQAAGKRRLELRSKGLCLVPISFTQKVSLDERIDKYARY